MLGIRLPAEAEEELTRHARSLGRGKSVIAREWILERLERESVDAEVRRTAEYLAKHETPEQLREAERRTDEWLRELDKEDGGYEWGERGPPL